MLILLYTFVVYKNENNRYRLKHNLHLKLFLSFEQIAKIGKKEAGRDEPSVLGRDRRKC